MSEHTDVEKLVEVLGGPVPCEPFVEGKGGGIDHGLNYRQRKAGADRLEALSSALADTQAALVAMTDKAHEHLDVLAAAERERGARIEAAYREGWEDGKLRGHWPIDDAWDESEARAALPAEQEKPA